MFIRSSRNRSASPEERVALPRCRQRARRATRVLILAAVFAATSLVQVSPWAQTSSELDELHERLEAARQEIESIQGQAQGVSAQIASIDEQAAAVERAVDASTALVERTQAEIGVLEADIAVTERRFRRASQRAEDIAVSVYKDGSTASLDLILGAEDLAELTSLLEYSSEISDQQNVVLVAAARLREELTAAQAELEVKLAEAQEVRVAQLEQRQHLTELRAAQQSKLSKLRQQIASEQREAEGIVERSEEIEAQLAAAAEAEAEVAAPAPAVGTPSSVSVGPSGSSGFAWPIRGAITSGYGPRWGRMHEGIDIDCVTGDAIASSRSGSVSSVSYDAGGYGNHVIVDHGGGYATLYAHMVSVSVSNGQAVGQGDVVGACGSTGASTGDHLHFEVRVNGVPQNPLAYLP